MWLCSSPRHCTLQTDPHCGHKYIDYLGGAQGLRGKALKASLLFCCTSGGFKKHWLQLWSITIAHSVNDLVYWHCIQDNPLDPGWVWIILILIFCFIKQKHPQKEAGKVQGDFNSVPCYRRLLCPAFHLHSSWSTVCHGDMQMGL